MADVCMKAVHLQTMHLLFLGRLAIESKTFTESKVHDRF